MSTSSDPLIHLGYISQATQLMRDRELDHLLERARERNEMNHITGMLLYAEGSFIQVLEGSASSVQQTFSMISADPQHKKIKVLFEEGLKSRHFHSWTMGFRRLDADEIAKAPGMNHFLQGSEPLSDFLIEQAKPARLIKEMFNFFKYA